MSCKIKAIKAWQVDLPLREGRYNWSGGNFVEVFDSTVVAVETDAGVTGYAECCPLGSAYLPSYATGVRAGIAEIAPKLIGWDPDRPRAAQPADGRGAARPSVCQGADRHRLLGHPGQGRRACRCTSCSAAREQEEVALYRAISQEDAGVMAEKIAGYRAEGYTKFQLKVGGDANDDIERIRACRAILAARRHPGLPTPIPAGRWPTRRGW